MSKFNVLALIAAAALLSSVVQANETAPAAAERVVKIGFCDKAETGRVVLKADSDESLALLGAELQKLGDAACASRGEQNSLIIQGKDGQRLSALPAGVSVVGVEAG